MKIKANALGCLLMVLLPALAGAGEIHYAVENDHTNLLYRVSESAVYSVKVTRDGQALTKGMVSVVLDNFGPNVVLQTNVNLAAGNPFVVKGTLTEPGFLRLRAKTPNGREFVWSVRYEPEKIKVSDKAIEHGYGMSHSCFPSIYKTLGDWLEN